MTANAILLDEKDNVATCTGEVAPGTPVTCFGRACAEVESTETIPIWHKIALRPIPKGGHVFKYGELIGEALRDIPRGAWVSHENIYSVPRDYASEYIGKKG
ncbi:hypothetical protein HMPREF9334_00723 [Selenomonas infelix ATCC 43532]|uniref:SAF domain-containing protein n=1 Tax=Selenomonas infelix ATCC 43532 TaxID=679201 RepID=G5GNR9_9FIRM|nr:UxaA family hydrolase [Selenomonas infelix]EHG21306.1 hypothetical protein HMPREF9334_00723 [Selenomonas infelix ATCC 43532]